MNVLYTIEALSSGSGRDGHVATSDGALDTELTAPKEMGGSGAGLNPEQLYAAGYSACFHSALRAVAGSKKVDISGSTVGARVSLGKTEADEFELAVELKVTIPGMDLQQVQELADAAHQVCPYSRASRGNIDVQVRAGQE